MLCSRCGATLSDTDQVGLCESCQTEGRGPAHEKGSEQDNSQLGGDEFNYSDEQESSASWFSPLIGLFAILAIGLCLFLLVSAMGGTSGRPSNAGVGSASSARVPIATPQRSHFSLNDIMVEVSGAFALQLAQSRINPGPPAVTIYFFRSRLQEEEMVQIKRLPKLTFETIYHRIGKKPLASLALQTPHDGQCTVDMLDKLELQLFESDAFVTANFPLPHSVTVNTSDPLVEVSKFNCHAFARGHTFELDVKGSCQPKDESQSCKWHVKDRFEIR